MPFPKLSCTKGTPWVSDGGPSFVVVCVCFLQIISTVIKLPYAFGSSAHFMTAVVSQYTKLKNINFFYRIINQLDLQVAKYCK